MSDSTTPGREIVICSVETFRERRRWLHASGADIVETIRTDGPHFAEYENGVGFMWECPGCGHVYSGNYGDEPVSGWNEPRWKRTGTRDRPTLEPSLGCSRWRDGECSAGHYWLRDGRLVPA